jgi:flagellar protein FliO/FliZ
MVLIASGTAEDLLAANRRTKPQVSWGATAETTASAAPSSSASPAAEGSSAPSAAAPSTGPAANAGSPVETGPAATGAPGQGQAENVPAYDYTAPNFGENRVSYPFLVLRTLAVLAILIIVVYLVFRVFLRNRHKIVTSTEVIKVLATYPLAGNKSLQIVQVADKVLILGITDSNINLITTLDDKETIDRIKLESSKETKGIASFRDQLLKFISGKAFGGQGQISNINEFKERIKKMKKL